MRLVIRTPSIHPASLASRLAERGRVVLDVRQPSEWRSCHIPGSQNVPLTRLRSRLTSLQQGKTIVTVCASGHRSAAAARVLLRAGYAVENLRGGMHAWSRAGHPVENQRRSP
jgi:rhodanese-related sulfurtransferase